jgi:hypothetical protein
MEKSAPHGRVANGPPGLRPGLISAHRMSFDRGPAMFCGTAGAERFRLIAPRGPSPAAA